MVKVRFAPSPTGYLHIGNIRIAYFNWLYALQNKGNFILRYDDTDQARSKQDYIDAIAQDLNWLMIHPDKIVYQSKRFDRYNEITEQLKNAGLLYPCYETSEELERRRKIKLSRKLAPIYDREALKLTKDEKQNYIQEGRRPHWRFLLPNFKTSPFETQRTEITWNDKVRGLQTIDLASMSDPILIREDDTYLYTLPSVIDDIDMQITHIIRGDDHVTNTGVQLAIFDALKANRPAFGHINLLTTSSGEGLSKRKAALSIRSLREDGFEPMAIASLAVLIGTSENVHAYSKIEDLLKNFDLKTASKSAAKFNIKDLERLNKEIIHQMDYTDIQDRLIQLNIQGTNAEPFWYAVRGNLNKVNDAYSWWRIIEDKNLQFPQPDEQEFLKCASNLLPPMPWNEATWKNWTKKIQEQTGRKGKMLFKPLRWALTGQENGPELALLLPLMTEDLVKTRLEA